MVAWLVRPGGIQSDDLPSRTLDLESRNALTFLGNLNAGSGLPKNANAAKQNYRATDIRYDEAFFCFVCLKLQTYEFV